MALTTDFTKSVLAGVQAYAKFCDALLKEGIETMLAGDADPGRVILRDYLKATVGFEQLGVEIGSFLKSLIFVSGPTGNPQARNLFSAISHLQRHARLTLRVMALSHGPAHGR